MSGKMKWLTDAQVAAGYERTPGAPNARSLRADHLQAREDRKRLVEALKQEATHCAPNGIRCWAPTDCTRTSAVRHVTCDRYNDLLSEVGE
jgi:hypothetical protein